MPSAAAGWSVDAAGGPLRNPAAPAAAVETRQVRLSSGTFSGSLLVHTGRSQLSDLD